MVNNDGHLPTDTATKLSRHGVASYRKRLQNRDEPENGSAITLQYADRFQDNLQARQMSLRTDGPHVRFVQATGAQHFREKNCMLPTSLALVDVKQPILIYPGGSYPAIFLECHLAFRDQT
jgi:hypothetical protein